MQGFQREIILAALMYNVININWVCFLMFLRSFAGGRSDQRFHPV
jgi:hypothetical protein